MRRMWLTVLVVVVGALVGGVTGAQADIQTFSVPSANAGLSGITAGPDGNLWFTEKNTFRIGRLSTTGQFSEFPVTINNAAPDSDVGPTAIVSGSDGQLWFLTDIGESLERISTTGTVSTAYFNADYPASALTWGDDGSAWLFESFGDANGNAILHITPTTGGGYTATDAYPDSGFSNDLYAMGTAPDGVAWFSTNSSPGAYLNSITDSGTVTSYPLNLPQITQEPAAIAFGAGGTPWFSAYYQGSFDGSGACCGVVGDLASGAAQVFSVGPQGDEQGMLVNDIITGPDGALWFSFTHAYADGYNGIGRITSSGQMQLLDTQGYAPTGIAFGADHDLYFIDASANVIGRIALNPSPFPGGVGGESGGSGGGSGSGSSSGGSGSGGSGARFAPPVIGIRLPTLATLARSRGLVLSCRLSRAGTCTVIAEVSPATARALGLKVTRHARAVTLSRAHAHLAKAGTARLTLLVPAVAQRRLRRLSRLSLSLVATATNPGVKSVSSRRRLTLSMRR